MSGTHELQRMPHGTMKTIHKYGDPWFLASGICEGIRQLEGKTAYHGYLYIVEIGDKVKIGHTRYLQQRLMTHQRNALSYSGLGIGRVLFSQEHTNHAENEKKLHACFSRCRINGSEIFNAKLESIWAELPRLDYLDETKSENDEALSVIEKVMSELRKPSLSDEIYTLKYVGLACAYKHKHAAIRQEVLDIAASLAEGEEDKVFDLLYSAVKDSFEWHDHLAEAKDNYTL